MPEPGESFDLSITPNRSESEIDFLSVLEKIASNGQLGWDKSSRDQDDNPKKTLSDGGEDLGVSEDPGKPKLSIPIGNMIFSVDGAASPPDKSVEPQSSSKIDRPVDGQVDIPSFMIGLDSIDFSPGRKAEIDSLKVASSKGDWQEPSFKVEDKVQLNVVGSQLLSIGDQGLVMVDNRAVDAKQIEILGSSREVELEDGIYERDGKGRVTATRSNKGQLSRRFKYDSGSPPDKPSQVTIGDTTYVRMGPITSSGKPVKSEGYDMHNWKMVDSRGRLTGNWYGDMRVSKDGVFSTYKNDSKELIQEGANGNKLTKIEVENRDNRGIWPADVDVYRADGSTIEASLTGSDIVSLKQTGQDEAVISWTKSGEERWSSSHDPPRIRRNMRLGADGSLSYLNEAGELIKETSDGGSQITKSDTTTSFDRFGRLLSSESEQGKRICQYETDQSGKSYLASVETTSSGSRSKWQRDKVTGVWQKDGNDAASKLRVLDDGVLEYVSTSTGRRSLETLSLKQIDFDNQGRPSEVKFPSGAQRTLVYDSFGLQSIKDEIPSPNQTDYKREWSRIGISQDYTDHSRKYRRSDLRVTDYGDLAYENAEGREHNSYADDLDRIARGEFVMSSESLLEAKHRLYDQVRSNGNLDFDRFKNWMQEFEKNAEENLVKPEKLVRTMNALSDILEAKNLSDSPYSADERETIVDTAMHNLARPLEIDQGSHPTCNVTSVEVYASVRHPDKYSELIRDVSLTGRWEALTGKVATPPLKALRPGKDETSYDLNKPDSGKRNIASQVFQMALINAMYETGEMNSKGEDRSDIRYIMEPSKTIRRREGNMIVSIDTGEDTLVRNGKALTKNGRKIEGPEMIQSNVLRSCEILFGETPPFIENASYLTDPRTRRRRYESDLISKDRLFEIKDKNRFPILTPTMGGMHAQTLHDVWQNPQNGEVWVLLDNQHGEPEVKGKNRRSGEGDGDGWIKLDTLHRTLRMKGEGRGFGQPVMPLIRKYDHPSRHY